MSKRIYTDLGGTMMNQTEVLRLPLNEIESEIITALFEQRNKEEITIGLFGSFSVGKSALLNRILNTNNLLPTHTNETTAIPTYLSYADALEIEQVLEDGQVNELTSEQLKNYVAGQSTESTKHLAIKWPGPNWMKDVVFVDTPGRNTKYQSHLEASEKAIINSDAAIYVMPWQGLTMEDIVYIQKIEIYQPNIYFVLNKIDAINEEAGETVEDIRKHIEDNLEVQLGRRFPVFATSAETGQQIEAFVENCILEIVSNMQDLKKKRFNHAIEQFLLSFEGRLKEEIHLLELVSDQDQTKLEAEYHKIEAERKSLQLEVESKVTSIQQKIKTEEADLFGSIKNEIVLLEDKIMTLANASKNKSEHDINLEIQHLLLLTRQTIARNIQARLSSLLGEHVKFQVNSIQGDQHTIHPTEYDVEDILYVFESEKQNRLNEYEMKKAQLEVIVQQDVSEVDQEELEHEIKSLEEELSTRYVPQMIEKVKKKSNEAESILKTMGSVADIALSVSLAVATAGGSAAAGGGAKIATKTAAKTAIKKGADTGAKVMAKQVAREVAEKGAIQIAKAVESKTSKDKGPGTITTILTELDKITSPFETIAAKIGKSIDGEDVVYEEEDLRYRQEFFAKQSEIEDRYERKKQEVRKLEKELEKRQADQKIAREKLMNLEIRQQAEISRQEQKMKQQIETARQTQRENHIENEVKQILQKEFNQYKLWIEFELERSIQAVSVALQYLSEEKLNRWEDQLNQMVALKENKEEETFIQLNEKRAWLAHCESLLEDVVHV